MTPTSKVMTEYCNQYINDIRLKKLANDNAPLYLWRMWQYLAPALSLYDNPSTMQDYLLTDLVTPKFNYTFYVVETTSATTTVTLGDEYKGFDLFSAAMVDEVGDYITMGNCTYDKTTGVVTITNAVEEEVYQFYFYTDGAFKNDLKMEEMNILGLCFNLVWELRFSNDFIGMTPKLEDKTFSEQNRANKLRADNDRIREIKTLLNETMNKQALNRLMRKTI